MKSIDNQKTNKGLAPDHLAVQKNTLLALLVFFVVLMSSPSIFRGFIPDTISKTAPLLLIGALALKGDFRLPMSFLLPWGLCFILTLVSAVQINLSSDNAAPTINTTVILVFALVLASKLKNEKFTNLLVKWWGILFWIVSVFSITNWILTHTVPSIFNEIDFGQLYEGNARSYLISPFGAVIMQDYGVFALYRVTGILAEPGMMSMFFLVNATFGFLSKNPVFGRRFNVVNLLAGFATHSVAFYLTLSILISAYFFRKDYRIFKALVIGAAFMLAVANYSFIEATIQEFLARSSFNVRDGDFKFLLQMIDGNPMGSLFGYAWWGDYRQLPAAFPQLFYQLGLIGAILYAAVLWFFLRKNFSVSMVVYIYGLSIDYQTFLIFPLMLFIVKAVNAGMEER